jgi:hypothetical protein
MGAYSGETQISPFVHRFSDPGVTLVIGGNPNIFGHALFRFGTDIGYVHVDTFYDYPKMLPAFAFPRYLRENDKRVMRQYNVDIPRPADALRRIAALQTEKWTWLVIPHNCVAFCEEILKAGGAPWEQISNLPGIVALITHPDGNMPPAGDQLIAIEGPEHLRNGELGTYKADLRAMPPGGRYDWSHDMHNTKEGLTLVQRSAGQITLRADGGGGTATLHLSYVAPGGGGAAYARLDIRIVGSTARIPRRRVS